MPTGSGTAGTGRTTAVAGPAADVPHLARDLLLARFRAAVAAAHLSAARVLQV
ncbi:hypothetical protein [Geodermatophilus sp. SYSU D01119]